MLQAATGAAAALTPAEQTWQTIAADLESGAAEAECPQVSLGLGFGFGLGLGLANPNPSPSPSANPSPNPNPDPNQCCSDPSGCVFRVRPLDVRGWSRPGSASAPAFPASAPAGRGGLVLGLLRLLLLLLLLSPVALALRVAVRAHAA